MDGLDLGPIDDEAQAKQLKREKMWNYKRASQTQLATVNELGLSKRWFEGPFCVCFQIIHYCRSFSSILQVVLNRLY
jgi:MoaA/NifB/PqqE/SkfB family radical SAM enzyme